MAVGASCPDCDPRLDPLRSSLYTTYQYWEIVARHAPCSCYHHGNYCPEFFHLCCMAVPARISSVEQILYQRSWVSPCAGCGWEHLLATNTVTPPHEYDRHLDHWHSPAR